MPLPENIHTSLLKRLTEEVELSETSAKSIIDSLNTDKPINWNILLNTELKQPAQSAS